MNRALPVLLRSAVVLVVLVALLGAIGAVWHRRHYSLPPGVSAEWTAGGPTASSEEERASQVVASFSDGSGGSGLDPTLSDDPRFATLARITKHPIQRTPWQEVNDLDAPTVRAAAREVALLLNLCEMFPAALQHQVEMGHQTTWQYFQDGPWKAWDNLQDIETYLDESRLTPSSRPGLSERLHRWRVRVRSVYEGPRASMAAQNRWAQAAAATIAQPWNPNRKLPVAPDDPVSQAKIVQVAQDDFRFALARTHLALLAGYLALRAYEKEKGSYPTSLDELVTGGYLDGVPIDAFSPTRAPLGYRRESPSTMRLWSVGPDGVNDAGRPIATPAKGENFQRYLIERTATGDFVAEINTPRNDPGVNIVRERQGEP